MIASFKIQALTADGQTKPLDTPDTSVVAYVVLYGRETMQQIAELDTIRACAQYISDQRTTIKTGLGA